MAQVTIYLDKDTEKKMRAHTRSTQISQSQWIASLIRERLQTEWPDAIVALSGAWQDFSTAEEIRADMGQDVTREAL